MQWISMGTMLARRACRSCHRRRRSSRKSSNLWRISETEVSLCERRDTAARAITSRFRADEGLVYGARCGIEGVAASHAEILLWVYGALSWQDHVWPVASHTKHLQRQRGRLPHPRRKSQLAMSDRERSAHICLRQR